MSDKYIVTGGLGFIGSNMVRFLDDRDVDVVVCERVRPDRYKNISGCRNVVDLINPGELLAYINTSYTIKGIFHLGACSDTMNFSDEVMKKNYEFTRDLVDQCIITKIPLIYASSASVYGVQRESIENAPTTPLNLYAFSKAMADQYIANKMVSADQKHRVVGMRYFNVYGPNERHKMGEHKMSSVIFQKYLELKDKGYIKLFKPGDQRRDFIHVDDVCQVNWAALNAKSGIYNVGTGEAPTFTEVAQALIDCVDPRGVIQYIDFPQELVGKYQDFTCADQTRLKTFYAYPFMDYKTGIKKAVEAYEEGR